MPVLIAIAACALALAVWVYLLTGRGGYWRTDQRLPGADAGPGRPDGDAGPGSDRDAGPRRPGAGAGARRWPGVVAVVPARNEAAVLPAALPTLLRQDYPGAFAVVLVDDDSSDGTSAVAAALGRAAPGHAASRPCDAWPCRLPAVPRMSVPRMSVPRMSVPRMTVPRITARRAGKIRPPFPAAGSG